MNDKKVIIPIVFSTNDTYALYCYLAIFSLLKFADKQNYYDIRVFMTSLSKEKIELLEGLTNEYAVVRCMNITSYVKDADLRELSFFSVETFYRLFISQILSEYEKIIYLDSDMLILHDIAPLFYTEMKGHPIAAVQDVVCSYLSGHAEELGLELQNMFNAGVLVIDTKKYNQQNIKQIGLKALTEDYKNGRRKFIYVDQDVLNVTVYKNVEFLDDRWNFQWEFLWRLDGIYDEYRERYERASKAPWIIHYAGDRKPWSNPSLPYANYFWNMAFEAGILQKIVERSLQIERENKELLNCFKGFRFPYERVREGSRVAIYAAGNVGQDFVKQLRNTLYARLTLWVDMQYDKKPKELKVRHPEQLIMCKEDWDYVVIAIDDRKIASKIIDYLKNLGVSDNKLIWQNYRRCDYE